MTNHQSFAEQIRERYPEGLTGVFAVGGTRTTYILDQNRDSDDPGHIEDFAAHGEYLLNRYLEFAQMFFDLGGQNMIITAFSFRGFYNRGEEYAQFVTQEMKRFTNDISLAYYHENDVDPYFTGIDTLLLFPESSPVHQLGVELRDFQANWDYQDGRQKLVWEIASIPLFTFWDMLNSMPADERATLQARIDDNAEDLEAVYRELYKTFSYQAYGTEIPMPHFYLGTNKSGDLKWRSPMPMTLSGGDYLRMFYTPYPTLFTTKETLHRILEDLAFKERFYSAKTDYKGRYTRELAQQEYERVMRLASDAENVVGLSRRVAVQDID